MRVYSSAIATATNVAGTAMDARSATKIGVRSVVGAAETLGYGIEVSEDGSTGWTKIPLGYSASGSDIAAAPWARITGPAAFSVDVTPWAYVRVVLRNDSGSSITPTVDASLVRMGIGGS